jgi:uncharacterized protein YbjT (DUF2867 family)
MIVITTPTGAIASQALATLVGGAEPVRVVARDPAKLPADLAAGVEIVTGSHGDPAVIDVALEGADSLFWVIPPDPRTSDVFASYVDFTRPAAEAIRRHGVSRVVAVSSTGRGYPGPAGLSTDAIAMTGLLESSGAATRSLACPGFMDNMLRSVDTLRDQGIFFGTMPADLKVPHASTGDIAAVAAGLLADPSWGGHADVPVLGAEDLSFTEVAQVLSEVLGKEIRYVPVSLDELRSQMQGMGASESFTDAMVSMMAAKGNGSDLLETRTPETSTPTSFQAWAEAVLKPAVLSRAEPS